MVNLDLLPDFLLNGVVLGSIIALAAIGLTLVYGILNLSNFAHGDYLTLGAYVAFLFNVTLVTAGDSMAAAWTGVALAGILAAGIVLDLAWTRRLETTERVVLGATAAVLLAAAAGKAIGPGNGLPPFLTGPMFLPIILAVVLVPVFAVLMDLLIWKPLRKKRATVLTFIIVSIGLALVIRHLLAVYFGSSLKSYDREFQLPIFFADLVITRVQATIVGLAFVLILAVHVILTYTRVGKGLRALADNLDLARVSGIDVDRMILYVWVIAGALAGVAGVMLAMNTNVNPSLGWNLLLPIFAAVILGGIGSPYGAMVGAFVIGISMEVSVLFNPNYRFAVAFLILILVLLVRPQGLLGGKA